MYFFLENGHVFFLGNWHSKILGLEKTTYKVSRAWKSS